MAIDSRAIGERICYYRTQAGYTKEQFSVMINLSRKHLYEIENGKCDPSLDTFVIIANALNVSADELLQDSLVASASASNELAEIFDGCSPKLKRILTQTVRYLKTILSSEDF